MASSRKERSSRNKASTGSVKRVHDFVKDNVFDVDISTGFLDAPVCFFPSEDETLHNVCCVVASEYPDLLKDFDVFLTKLRFFYFESYLKTISHYSLGVDHQQNDDQECCDESGNLLHHHENSEDV